MLRVQPAKQHFLEKLRHEEAEEKAEEEENRKKRLLEDEQAQEQERRPASRSEAPLILIRPDGKVVISSGVYGFTLDLILDLS